MTAITVEYGLYEQRFWLPRGRSAEFFARAGLFRVPGKIEQRYQYDGVNSGAPFDAVVLPARDTHSDSAMRDSLAATGLAVEQAEIDASGVLREDREVDALAIPVGSEWKRPPR